MPEAEVAVRLTAFPLKTTWLMLPPDRRRSPAPEPISIRLMLLDQQLPPRLKVKHDPETLQWADAASQPGNLARPVEGSRWTLPHSAEDPKEAEE